LNDARRVTVALGQEASNTDFALVPGRAVSVSGTALDSRGRPLAGRNVALLDQVKGPGTLMLMNVTQTTSAGDGSFTLKNVPPGEYIARVQGAVETGSVTSN
jgi:hypothetical protein